MARVRARAAQHRYDVCHAHFVLPTGLVPYALRRRPGFPPYVVTCHGSDLPGYNPDRFTRLHRITPPLIRRILLAASRVIVPSAALEGLLRASFDGRRPPRVAQIANGVDVERYRTGAKEPRVLIATRLFERKGVQHVLDALATAGVERYGVDVAGDGPERGALERRAREAGVPVQFHGWLPRERLDALFERSRVFVLASTSDNFPVSLLEAMAARCAVVTTRTGGIPEVVGDAAILVDVADVGGLRAALQRLLSDPALAAELGDRGRQRVLQLFGWPSIVARHEDLYRSAIDSGAVAPAWVLAPR